MKYAVRRVLSVIPVLFVLVTVVFLAMRWLPGSPATSLAAGGNSQASSEQISAAEERIRVALGLDDPLWLQYVNFLSDLVRLDFGRSFFGSNSVLGLVADALPATVELTVAAMLIAIAIGLLTGTVAAVRKDTIVDVGIRAGATVSFSLPWFALGVLGVVVFGVVLGWLPIIGRMPASVGYVPTTGFVLIDAILQARPDLIGPWIQHLILPATTLALSMAGFITRIVRTAMLEVLGDDFVRTARMKGLAQGVIMRRHVLRNASLPIVTVLGLQFGSLLGGSLITETVFSYPGIGNLLVSAVHQRDYPVVQAAALAVAFLFVLVNVVVDLLYLVLDPRLRKATA
jgi:peptide/nickel transport system permease protein